MSVLLELRGRALAEVEAAFFELTQQAEAAREAETAASVRIEKSWRGYKTRVVITSWNVHALVMNRVTRGYLSRQRAARMRIARDTERQRAFFDAHASAIQLRFRGFHSRKYVHNFYARKSYVMAVVHKGEAMRRDMQASLEQQAAAEAARVETEGRQKVNELSMRLHHLRSTETCPGMFNSPYHVGFHPTAFGVPIEEHLRTAIKPYLRKTIKEAKKSLRPIGSLPPIKPCHSPSPHDAVRVAQRESDLLSKSQRVGPDDFLPSGRTASPQYQGSVHVNAGYHPPRGNLDREVDKTKWVAKETFYNSVPSNRYVSSAGTERSATPLVPLDMSLS